MTTTLIPVLASAVSTCWSASNSLTVVMPFRFSSRTTDAVSGRLFATLP
uniref:Secreted protein n=1 Tax=Arundo donax TaxID=35708 RepID=A0A0A9CYW4_ARUDO